MLICRGMSITMTTIMSTTTIIIMTIIMTTIMTIIMTTIMTIQMTTMTIAMKTTIILMKWQSRQQNRRFMSIHMMASSSITTMNRAISITPTITDIATTITPAWRASLTLSST